MQQLKRYKWPLLTLLTLAITLAVSWYLWRRSHYPSTDDAYLNANVVRIASQVSGPVQRVAVSDQQEVTAGQLLFEIDPKPFKIALQMAEAEMAQTSSNLSVASSAVDTARAQLAQAQANFNDANKNERRIEKLVSQGMASKADGDHAKAMYQTTMAAVTAAKSALQQAIEKRGEVGNTNAQTRIALARVEQARLNLSYTQVRAPVSGIISNFSIRAGTTVNAGQALFALVDTSEWWVDANFKETDLQRIKPGEPASVTLDMYPDMTFKGVVESVSPASGAAFSLLPPENATGNWVKVTQRFPVRVRIIKPDPKLFLRIGASSTVTINTLKHSELPAAKN